MTETVAEELKRYVRFSPDDEARLRRLGAVARPHLPRIAREFYDRIREHEAAHAVFTGEVQIARLQSTLVTWMERLFDGPHDDAYFEERARAGRMHVRIRLPQRYMFGAMALIRSALTAAAGALPEPERDAVRDSLDRALDIELAIMLEAYDADLSRRMSDLVDGEHQRRVAQLELSEQQYVHAIEAARLLVVAIGRDGHVSLFNREAERITSRSRDEVIGRPAALLFPERERGSALVAGLGALAHAGALPATVVLPVLAVTGHERAVEWSFSRVDGSSARLVAIGRDVTDVLAHEAERSRTERLAAVGTLAAGLAHEIRNPLNGALLHVTYLERALRKVDASPETLTAVKLVDEEIRRLSDLVRDFLVFARPTPPSIKASSIHEICTRAVGLVRTDVAPGVHVALDLGTADTTVPLDASKIEQVLLNLLRNAVDAVAGAGGGHVTLRERRRPNEILLEVEDDGPGVSTPDAPIFDAFYTTKPAGTGLGLSIVHRIVSDHGGSVSVHSKPGRTVFDVLLPLRSRGETT